MLRLPKDEDYISDSIKNYLNKELNIMWNDIFKPTKLGVIPLKFVNGVCMDISQTIDSIKNYNLLFIHTDDSEVGGEYLVQEIIIPLYKGVPFSSVISKHDINGAFNSLETILRVNNSTGLIEISTSKFLQVKTYVYGTRDSTRINETNSLNIYGIGLKKKFNLLGILTHLFSYMKGGALICLEFKINL